MQVQSTRRNHFFRTISLTALIVIIGAVSVVLYPRLHPWGGLRLDTDQDALREAVRGVLTDLDIAPNDHALRTAVNGNPEILDRTYRMYGIREGNRLLRAHLPGYQWKIQAVRQDSDAVQLHFGSQPDEGEIERMVLGDIGMQMDMDEKLIQLRLQLGDSLRLPSADVAEAYAAARDFLIRHAAPGLIGPLSGVPAIPDSAAGMFTYRSIRCSSSQHPGRMDHTFAWVTYDENLADSIDVSVTVAGRTVSGLTSSYRSLEGSRADEATGMVEIFEIIFYAVLVILLAVVGLRRARAYEIGFRAALPLGIASGLLFSVYLAMELGSSLDSMLALIAILLLVSLMIVAGMTLLWAVSESVGREVWREKFISFDLLTSGNVMHSQLGASVLTGVAAGFFLLLAALASGAISSGFDLPIWILERGQNEHAYLTTDFPAVFLTAETLVSNIAGLAFFLIFFISLLRMRIRGTFLLAAAAGIPLAFVDLPNLVPLPAAYIVLIPLMLILVVLFLRTDVITTLTALVTLGLLHRALFFILPWNGAYFGEAMFLGVILVAVIAYAYITQTAPDRVQDFDQIAPRYQQHISERQRLARELEIARDVQMSFLPKREPVIGGLDIASHCVPALEVGGDYYDFMDLGPGKLGIAIGDVSGKGTQAAFYMTLTKGFLKALGSISISPAQVLRQMNQLFYENVERGHFISMIYAVFDMEKRSLTVARAGHSPVMRRRRDAPVDVIRSRGMAVGFDAGGKFSESIEEITVPLQSGDVFVFYTDGYPEAMTRRREEFGEQRLSEALERCADRGAQDILSHLYREIRRFTGRAEQHDDMTMVVVRVE